MTLPLGNESVFLDESPGVCWGPHLHLLYNLITIPKPHPQMDQMDGSPMKPNPGYMVDGPAQPSLGITFLVCRLVKIRITCPCFKCLVVIYSILPLFFLKEFVTKHLFTEWVFEPCRNHYHFGRPAFFSQG